MSDFCKQCSEELFGKDFGELRGLTTEANTQDGLFASVICEGCGFVAVDHLGQCVGERCSKGHKAEMPEKPFICPQCGSRYFGRETELQNDKVVVLSKVCCHDEHGKGCKWRGCWP